MERAENRTAKTKAARELREDDLARIAEMLNNGVSQRKSAEAMGVSQSDEGALDETGNLLEGNIETGLSVYEWGTKTDI